MDTVTINLSLQAAQLAEIDAAARREARSRSELLREAARRYVLRQRQWDDVFTLGDQLAHQHQLTEQDIAHEVVQHRATRHRRT